MRTLVAFGVLLATTTLVPAASAARVHAGEVTGAAGIGAIGTFSIGAERMFGFTWNQLSIDESVPGETITFHDKDTTFGLLWNPSTGTSLDVGGGVSVPKPYNVPRIGFDFAVVDAVTIGGSIGYLGNWNSTETMQPGITTATDGPKTDVFLIAPRAGWVIGVGRPLALWLRGGFTYWNVSVDPRDNRGRTFGANGFALTLEPQLVISPIDHVGISIGLDADIPLSGSFKTTYGGVTTSQNASVTNVGTTAGLLVWF